MTAASDNGALLSMAARKSQPLLNLFDLFGEDSWRNVYAGELYVRPPAAPTTQWPLEAAELP